MIGAFAFREGVTEPYYANPHELMRAIRIEQTGGPEVLRLEELPDLAPTPGHAVARIEASGLNFIDSLVRRGVYPVQLPFTLGYEAAGVVESVVYLQKVRGLRPATDQVYKLDSPRTHRCRRPGFRRRPVRRPAA